MIKKILLYFFSFLLLGYNNTFAQNQNLKEYRSAAAMQWLARSAACNALCLSGDCEKGNVCGNFDTYREAYKMAGIDQAVYISEKQFYLKESYKKYFLGNTKETRLLKLLDDNKDRFMIYLVGKPNGLTRGKESDVAPVQRVNSSDISLADLEAKGDLPLGKIPDEFPDSFEVGVELARYCAKLVCEVWSPYHRLHLLEHKMASLKFPVMPVLIDTNSVKSPEAFSYRKRITLKIPFAADRKKFTAFEVRDIFDSLYEPSFTIEGIIINAFPSMLGDPVLNKMRLNQLAQQFLQITASFPEGASQRTRVTTGDSWLHFKEALLKTNLYYLADSGEQYVRKRIATDQFLRKRLQPLLNQLNMASIEMQVVFDETKMTEAEYWKNRMRLALDRDDYAKALSYQKPLIRLMGTKKIPVEDLMPSGFYVNPYNMSLFNNQNAYTENLKDQKEQFEHMQNVDPNNPLIKYNYLANRLNAIRDYQEDTLRDAMLNLLTDFNTINSTSIPASLYEILNTRFYYYNNATRKDRKLISMADVNGTSRHVPPGEAIKFADDLLRFNRYDLAYQILATHLDQIGADEKELSIQYAFRMLYYGHFSSLEISPNDYYKIIERLHRADKKLLALLFGEHELSYLFFADNRIRKMYEESVIQR